MLNVLTIPERVVELKYNDTFTHVHEFTEFIKISRPPNSVPVFELQFFS